MAAPFPKAAAAGPAGAPSWRRQNAAWQVPRGTLPDEQGGVQHRVKLTLQAPPGSVLQVCPALRICPEFRFLVTVLRAVPQSASGAIEVTGEWQRKLSGTAEQLAKVLVTLVPPDAVHSKPYVRAAKGPGGFPRCAEEQWLLDGVGDLRQQLKPGMKIALQRSPDRVLVLRSPEEQVSMLLMQYSNQRLLAAPASNGIISVMAVKATGKALIPLQIVEDLERRFSIILPDMDANARKDLELLRLEEAPEATLRKLLACGVRHCLQQAGWLSVETPFRLCLEEALRGLDTAPQLRTSVRVPSVDVRCLSARVDGNQIVAEIGLTPAVRLTQPLLPHLLRAKQQPDLVGTFGVDEQSRCVGQPVIAVLPRLTPAEITHLWTEALPPMEMLPADLRDVDRFVDYWRLIHGQRLHPQRLGGFARVCFRSGGGCEAGLVLTYPLTCLWKRHWTILPQFSRQHGPKIVQQALLALAAGSLLGSSPSATLVDALQAEPPRGPPAPFLVPASQVAAPVALAQAPSGSETPKARSHAVPPPAKARPVATPARAGMRQQPPVALASQVALQRPAAPQVKSPEKQKEAPGRRRRLLLPPLNPPPQEIVPEPAGPAAEPQEKKRRR